ncbi:MAG: hypothetical protein IT373_21445 [Polyangiaceae bacterium]|nr:hypothetical protein [Polyangiaceae bacterium]
MKRAVQASMWTLGMWMVGCQGAPGGVGTAAQALTAPELAATLAGGAQRIEIKLDASMHAIEVELEPGHGEEHVEGRVVAVDAAGSVTLDLDGLVVAFDAATRLRDASGADATAAAWVATLEGALASGTPVFARASRPLPAVPAAPGDATFVARDLRLEGALDDAKIELLVDADNFTLSADGGTFEVLGELVHVSAETELWSDDVDGEGSDDAADDGPDPADDHGGGTGGSDDPAGSETPG